MGSREKAIPAVRKEAQAKAAAATDHVNRSLVGSIWQRLLETEMLDRSVSLGAKAFTSFFPVIITVAALMPARVRTDILSALLRRLGIEGQAVALFDAAFATPDEIREGAGLFGLVLTIFFASSFTAALERVYLRAWRRPAGGGLGPYRRGAAWVLAMLGYLALLGAAGRFLLGGPTTILFAILVLAAGTGLWWFTAWLMLMRPVRPRVLASSGLITAVTISVYALSARLWMPINLEWDQEQFGFFGISLGLITWFSGAAVCIVFGACAGPVLAEDSGAIGRFVRGSTDGVLAPGAAPSLPAPLPTAATDAAAMDLDDDTPARRLPT